MSGGTQEVVFDGCTLENFSAVGRLDLLKSFYGNRCRWMTVVEQEIAVRAPVRPDLRDIDRSWLGEPIDTNDPPVMQRVDLIRRALGGSPQRPTEHLGEAQIIGHLESIGEGILATDDRDAADLARRRGLTVIDTVDIITECFEAGLIGCPDAHELLVSMESNGRGIQVPPSHWHVCVPPPASSQ